MRKLITKIILFVAVLNVIGTIDFTVLLAGLGVAITLVVCLDLLLASPSTR
jgi:hypothetical protein